MARVDLGGGHCYALFSETAFSEKGPPLRKFEPSLLNSLTAFSTSDWYFNKMFAVDDATSASIDSTPNDVKCAPSRSSRRPTGSSSCRAGESSARFGRSDRPAPR